jgi:HAD superfamily hydrolase (TIGR01484 family)
MRYHVLAVDYDGTLAHHGKVSEETLAALRRLKDSGRHLVMVSGRQKEDLERVFPHSALFDLLVLENGALLHTPGSQELRVLCAPPDPRFVAALERRGVKDVAVGHAIVATWQPHHAQVLEAIRELGLDLQVIFNKDAVMVLPTGVNKATGLAAALARLGLSPHNAVAIGDAENDHPMLAMCECGVAVANALPALAERADLVTHGDHGRGVTELIERLVATDLADLAPRLVRHDVPLGAAEGGQEVCLPAYGHSVLLAGTSGSGKSTVAKGLLERVCERGYQFCVIDPEGDYAGVLGAVTLGDTSHAPGAAEVAGLLEDPKNNAVVSLLGVKLADRPAFFDQLFAQLAQMRTRTGRPHWIVLDEVHHLVPTDWAPAPVSAPGRLRNLLLVTVHPDHVSRAVLEAVHVALATGQDPAGTLRAFAEARGLEAPPVPADTVPPGEVVAWWPGREPLRVRTIAPTFEHTRHIRKYATGEVPLEENFIFSGPKGKLKLRAQNLTLFVQIAQGVDDETWLYHLKRGDYSKWFRTVIKDPGLAAEAAGVEANARDAKKSREAIVSAIERRYTAPA